VRSLMRPHLRTRPARCAHRRQRTVSRGDARDVDAALTANPPTLYRVPRASVESPMNPSQ
jgi:hypothetical protein